MESKLINYSIFIEKRPDMEIHTEVAIVSCINSAYVLLDGECASLISQVDKFNMVDDRSQLDTNHELYRTDFELGQLQEALVFQVQYVLNMGNDFTVGGGSYSIGNINSSYSRPEGRELIAPGVYKLLSNARVYHLNAFGSFSNHNTNEIPLSTSKEIMERVKNEYVAQNQPNAQVGNVAYINQSHQVSFGSPQDLQITTYNTNRIAGPEGYRNNFYEIDSVPNIAFFGPDYNGTYSAVHRQEMIDYVNQNAGENLGQEIAQIKQEQEEQNNNITSNTNQITQIKEDIKEVNSKVDGTYDEVIDLLNITIPNIDKKILINTNAISSNKSFIDNLNQRVGANSNNIQTNTTNIQTNTNNITALDSRLLSVSGLLTQTIDGLRTLRPFKYVGEYQNGTSYNINQLVSYQNNLYLSKEDNNNTIPTSDKWLLINKDTISVDLSDYPTRLEVEAIKNTLQQSITSNTTNITTNKNNIDKLNNEVVKIAGQQIITGKKIFTGPGEGIQIRPNATGGSSYITGYDFEGKTKKWVLGNTGRNEGMLLEAPLGDIYLKPGANGNIQCYNKLVRQVADPTANTDAATKKYVDNKVSTNTTNITTIRNNYLDKTATGAQQIAATSLYVNNQLVVNTPYNPNMTPNADLYVSGQGFIENFEADNATFNTSIIVPTPTQNDHAATKQYVDNAIKNITPGSGGSIPQETLNQIETNKNNITDLTNRTNTIEQNYLSKNSNVLQVVKGGVDFTAQVILKQKGFVDNVDSTINTSMVNIQYVKDNTTLLTTDQTINGTKTFTNQIVANQGLKTAASQTITSGNLEVGSGSTFAYMTSDDDRAKSLKFSGLSGRGKLDLDMGSASKITNLPDPINNQDAATKNYVDTTIKNKVNAGWTFLNSVFETEENERYSNLNRWNEQIFSLSNVIDYSKPITVSFTRYNKQKGNGTIPLGTYAGTILYNPNQTHYVVGTNLFYDTTQKGTGNMEQGGVVGLLITPDYIQVQCWDGNDQIGDIKIFCWSNTMIPN